MEHEKLHRIIEEKNQHLEREAVRTASSLLEDIVEQQAIIIAATEKITQLRKELTELKVEQLDTKKILGSE